MADPIDDIVIQENETSVVSSKLTEYLTSAYNKLKSYFMHEEEIGVQEELGPEFVELDTPRISPPQSPASPVQSVTSKGSPRQHHVKHPYCISTPHNPFIENFEGEWEIEGAPRPSESSSLR